MIVVPRSAILLAMLAMALGGCTTPSLQDVAPTAALPTPRPETTAPTPPDSAKPAQAAAESPPAEPVVAETAPAKGDYPNLNVRPGAAASQLTEAEKAAEIARLKGVRQAQAGKAEGAAPSDVNRLRKLARTHAAEALDEIEK